ncbi:MAG: phosphoribosylanthranilate isomerase [Acidobacteria bacterium]|nr:phosphoribosylanthranilate isomerase [Acidobacteriota bacterium]
MVKVKICGITNLEDALATAELGADMLGFNFYSGSKRHIELATAAGIVKRLESGIESIGVFVNADMEAIQRTVDIVGLTAVQLHGDETPEFVAKISEACGVPVIKAIRVSADFRAEAVRDIPVDSILLDVYSPEAYGGTGEQFDWRIASEVRQHVERLFLAGGLTPKNVGEAVKLVRPYAVDVASGVESSARKKDAKKMEAFIRNAKGI